MAKRLLSVERIVSLSSDPASAEGGLYYNSVTKTLRYHNGTSWESLTSASGSTGQYYGDTPPVSPSVSDLWFDTSTGKTYVYYDSYWIEIGTSEGGRPLQLTGDVIASGTDVIATTLSPSGVGAGTYGSTSAIPVVTVDIKGRVTAISTASISTTLVGLADVNTTSVTDNDILSYNSGSSKWVNQNLATAITEVDGAGSLIDSDLLDGQQGSYYTTAGNLSGTIPSGVLGNSTVFIGTTGIALNRTSAALSLSGITLAAPTFTGTMTTSLTTGGYVTTTSGGVLGSVATIPNAGLTNSSVTIGSTSVSLGGTAATVAGLTLTTPVIDSISASAAAATPSLWPTITTGSIAIGAGLTTGALNIATVGTGATPIAIGHTNATVGITGNTTVTGTLTVTGNLDTNLTVAGYVTTSASGLISSVATIPNAGLTNSSVTIGSTAVSLGATVTTFAGVTLSSPTFSGTVTTPLTTAGYVTTTSGGVLGSVATIPNAGLTNSSVTVGTTAIALGASSTTLAGLTSVTATTFTGALSGNATSATNATNTGITEDTATAVAVYPTWVTANTGNLPQKTTSTRLSFVPSTGVLSATQFSGSGAGLTSIPQSGVTSLTTDLAAKAPLASPTFTGTVTSPKYVASGTQTLAEYRMRNIYVSTTDPGTGNDGDIWLKY